MSGGGLCTWLLLLPTTRDPVSNDQKKKKKTESEIRTRAEMEINVNDGVVVVVRITTSIFMATIQGRMVNKKRETAFDQMTSE